MKRRTLLNLSTGLLLGAPLINLSDRLAKQLGLKSTQFCVHCHQLGHASNACPTPTGAVCDRCDDTHPTQDCQKP